jgi:hypothetical protein
LPAGLPETHRVRKVHSDLALLCALSCVRQAASEPGACAWTAARALHVIPHKPRGIFHLCTWLRVEGNHMVGMGPGPVVTGRDICQFGLVEWSSA